LRFYGRVSSRLKLKPGSYTLLVSAASAGLQSLPRTLHFTITR
jgi:hypothetical protein